MRMSIEEKRQSIYAALLRYSPEASSLRERFLDRLVLAALLGSSESEPLRVGAIQKNIKFGPGSFGFRVEIIQDTLERLIFQNKTGHILFKQRHAYYLKEIGIKDIDSAALSADRLFEPVLKKMLTDTSHLCREEDAVTVCCRFISECFARFGGKIAKVVTGDFEHHKIVEAINARAIFYASTEGLDFSPEALESLEIRCLRFLRSTERQDEELKFRLAQGYYVAQLLGIDSAQFNP